MTLAQCGLRRIFPLATGTLLAIAMTACGSSGSSGSSGSGNAGSGASKLGSPITVLVTAPVNSPSSSLPQWIDAGKIYAAQVNAQGGWDGHQVNIVGCDNQVI